MNQAARKTSIDIDDTPFVRSHCRAPRGFGSWAFSVDASPKDVCKDVESQP